MLYEAISAFDIFKIGIGPSSSHTLGPWRAAQRFVQSLHEKKILFDIIEVRVLLYGSLAKTGKGHGTDVAVQLGLCDEDPETFEVDFVESRIKDIAAMNKIILMGEHEVDFNPSEDIEFFISESLPAHPNALTFLATSSRGVAIAETYYSIGGGFVIREGEDKQTNKNIRQLPFPINTAGDLLHWCIKTGLSISDIVLENEQTWRTENETREGMLNIWRVMKECIYKGCNTKGMLPGGLQVNRRAAVLNNKLLGEKPYADYSSWLSALRSGGSDFKYILDWVSCFALAVNE